MMDTIETLSTVLVVWASMLQVWWQLFETLESIEMVAWITNCQMARWPVSRHVCLEINLAHRMVSCRLNAYTIFKFKCLNMHSKVSGLDLRTPQD